ncbi:hypothetical protein Y032_0132g1730 [Ancylostoma ceylanicum]|uniref:Uncharacterized protein n=1 Tax=Ancylostoma ceylanicum TaxID=53326 RepID=A0A016T6W1_9BILA|nr:hypothetical protein Y032_0132g1730 [Ancylostoma ceylanicum]
MVAGTYSKLQTAVDKGHDRGAATLVVCCTEAASGLHAASTGAARNQSARATVPPLVYGRLEFTEMVRIDGSAREGPFGNRDKEEGNIMIHMCS